MQVPASTLLLLLPLFGQALVTSAEDCPPASAVDSRVRTILGLDATDVLRERAEIGREEALLRITLRAEDGQILGDRSVRADGTCEELAGVAAVVLATWLSDVHPEFVGSLPPSHEEKPAAPAPEPVVDRGSAEPARREPESEHETTTGSFMFDAAMGGAFSATEPVLAGSLGARWLPVSGGFGWSLEAIVTAPHDQPLGSGNVRYWRWPLSTGPVFRVAPGSTKLDFHAGAALAWLHLAGEGFAQPETRDSALGGLVAALRISQQTRDFEPFIELTGIGWPEVRPYLSPSDRDVLLPRLELYLAIGASLTAR